MHFLDEILPERNQEKDSKDSAEQGREEDLGEVYGQFGIFVLQDVQGRKSEDRSGHDRSGAGTDGLDHYVLSEGVLPSKGCRKSHCDDCNRNGCLENLAYLQSEICRRG